MKTMKSSSATVQAIQLVSVLIYKYTNSTIINLRQLDLRCMKLLTVASVTAVPDLIICIC